MVGGSGRRIGGRAEILTSSLRGAGRRVERAGAAPILAWEATLGGATADSDFNSGGSHQVTEARHIILQSLVQVLHAVKFVFQLLLTDGGSTGGRGRKIGTRGKGRRSTGN